MAKHEAVKNDDLERLKKDWHDDVQLPANLKIHQQAFSEVLKELESGCDGHLEVLTCLNIK